MPELYFQDHPGPQEHAPLVLLHGLFGSGANWRGIARRLSAGRRVLVMDMRNHGRSFNDSTMTYPQMARDVLDTLDGQGIDHADLLGHSMGGKVAMAAALDNPGRVNRLIVVDIAPVIYTHTHMPLIEAMMSLDASSLGSRAEADEKLGSSIRDQMTRGFLLQSLEKNADEGYRWRLNLEALQRGMDDLVGFPEFPDKTFDGPVLFVYGSDSEYVQHEHRPGISRYFPNAGYAAVEDAGHWVHADQPGLLIEQVEKFLKDND